MATTHKWVQTSNEVTYGAELELVDWPRREPLVPGMAIDEAERANVNSNGIAVDGRGKLYHLGGEILTVPSTSPEGPADQMAWIKNKWPQATVNFRTGLNIHVRVPGLRDDLKKLKQLQAFTHRVMPELLPIIDPLPMPTVQAFPNKAVRAAAKRDYLRCRKNHHSLLPQWRLDLQMKARTPKEFFEAEAVHVATGEVHWALALRTCVNLRQLMQTDTVEFRHFPGSASPGEISNATRWCKMFLEVAFGSDTVSANEMLAEFGLPGKAWPKPAPYIPWLDQGYFYTSRHYNSDEDVLTHIAEWQTRHRKRIAALPNQELFL